MVLETLSCTCDALEALERSFQTEAFRTPERLHVLCQISGLGSVVSCAFVDVSNCWSEDTNNNRMAIVANNVDV